MKKINIKRFEDMNVIPFIDIMLVLLAIVLTTATFVEQGLIPVKLPQSSETISQRNEDTTWKISVDEKKSLFLNGEKKDLATLETALMSADKDQNFILRIDASVDFQSFISLMELFKRYQLANVSIQANQMPTLSQTKQPSSGQASL